jgi:choline kinase
MSELTDNKPKCLIEFRGRSLLEWQLAAMRSAGISQIAVVTGYMRETVPLQGLKEFRNERWAQTNMVSSLEYAEEWLSIAHCIVSYSDIYYSASSIKPLMEDTNPLAIAYDPYWLDQWSRRFANPLDDAETFILDKESMVLEIGGKTKTYESIQGQYMGLLSFRPDGWAMFKQMRTEMDDAETDQMQLTEAISRLVSLGYCQVRGIPVEDEWLELDTQDDIRILE